MLAEEILVVNDGSLLLQMVGGLLQNKGYLLNLTDSPEEALVLLSTRQIVLVVLKLDGRQTDRLAVMHQVKERKDDTRLAIVGESSQLPPEIFEIEADDYILLPCRLADIWRRLSRSLGSRGPQTPVFQEDARMHPVNYRVFHNLGLMFHDMRGLLTSVNEGMKLLDRRLDGRFGDEVEAIFQKTFQKTRTLLEVSEEFFQKFLNSNRHRATCQRVDLRREVIDPVVREFGEVLQNNQITLENRLSLLPSAQQTVRGDVIALKSVFRNLMHNAIIHGGCGCTICIEVDTSPGHFRLQVRNNGAPISKCHQKALFSGGWKHRGNGQVPGLGLHLGREMMRSLGGDVSCESGRQGADFIMTLPRPQP